MKRHPAKYSEQFIPIFAELLCDRNIVLDPFAGTGKIGEIKNYGYCGTVYANELEPEWLKPNEHNCDVCTYQDAEFLDYPHKFFDAICTSPTYGNRMADHHNAKDGSYRNTYTHCLGHALHDGNTGKMQWGQEYRRKHIRVYLHIYEILKDGGIFILNIKNHIRNSKEVNVKEFHESTLIDIGFIKEKEIFIKTRSNRCGANSEKRTEGEYILVFKKRLSDELSNTVSI